MNKVAILLVDDEQEFLELMQRRLGRRGFEVSVASSGPEALILARERDFDVVLLDVLMPGMDGLETLRRLREVRPDTEVVMLTGHANIEAAERGMALGIFDYLIKPVAINELIMKLGDAAQHRRLVHGGGAS